MAIQEGPIFREGVTIDGIIYYKWRGKYLMRAVPGKGGVAQTKATRRSSQSFGIASTAARLLYRSFEKVIPAYLNNRAMHNRVRGVMRKVVGKENSYKNATLWNYGYLEQFAFNDQATLHPHMQDEHICRMRNKNSVTVSVLKMNLKQIRAPKAAHSLCLRLMAVVFDFSRNKQKADELLEMHFYYNDPEIPAKEVMFHFPKGMKAGDVLIVALQLSFFNSRNKLISTVKSREFEASGIIGVFVV